MVNESEALAAADGLAAALRSGAAERDRAPAGTVPWDALELLDASGLLSITLPADVGGLDAGPVLLAQVVARLAAADPAIAQVPQAHFLLLDVLTVWGGEDVRARLRGEVAGGGVRIGNALAERGGQHAQDLKTRLARAPADGRWRLDGAKHYCTGALSARWIGVSALDDDGRLKLVFVEREAQGVGVETDWDVIGQRATVSGTVTFEDVVVEDALALDFAHAFEVPQQLGARAQLVHAAIEAGIARGALDDARTYLMDKARPSTEAVRAGAARAVEDPHVLHRYGRAAVDVRAAEALLLDAARELEDIGLVPADAEAAARGSLAVAAAKAFASDVAVRVSSELFALCGTSSAQAKYDLDRHWRNARTHSVHDPADWKYHHLGAYELAGVLPPNHSQL
ncbi:acyl-CoA dehydrogenase family protein [Conexibacter woesei]|uniref:acyl-CoA dehydrogenase family protein n=1 Tax=Conexibacter woesei TaxID=191495 RepID=UPI0004790BD0